MIREGQQEIATPKVREIAPSDNSRTRKPLNATRRLTYLATFTAISLVLKMVGNNISDAIPFFGNVLKLSVSYLGWYLTAAIMGPSAGGAVAALTDILGQFTTVKFQPPIPVNVIGNMLATMLFGVIYERLRQENHSLRALVAVTASIFVGTLGLNTLGLYLTYAPGVNYFAYFVSRLPQVVMPYLNVVLFLALLPVCRRIGLLGEDYRRVKK